MIIIVILLIALSALFSGLTIGMFSLSITGLERKIKMGDKRAVRILAIRRNGNYLLCTLVLGNVAVNAAVGQVLADIMPAGFVAGAITTGLIFLFGDMMPQAVVARHAFRISAATTWLVRIFMWIMSPIAWPLSLFLDWVLGKEHAEIYSKQEFVEMINDQDNESIDKEERRILVNAMHFSEKTAEDVMTPVTMLFYLDASEELNGKLLSCIKTEYYSRIPVIDGDRDNVVGVLYAKDLIAEGYTIDHLKSAASEGYHAKVDETKGGQSSGYFDRFMEKNGIAEPKKVGDLCKKDNVLKVSADMNLDDLMGHMIKSKTHISFVYNEYSTLLGVVTLEDILEQIIGEEIMDESDTVADLQAPAKDIVSIESN